MKLTIVTISLIHLSFFSLAQYQMQVNSKGSGYYVNPIFAGDYADPSILRDGEDYYIVHSSFEYYPGLLIWHSKDLINWAPVKNALHKYVGSVWAPDLVKYKNRYYIYFPANGTNYVVTADSINGKWSDPIDLKIGHIDPGHVVDESEKRYLFFSSGGFVPLSDDGLSVAGEFKHSYSGWPIPREWSIECFCMESPKLVKRGAYYYLTMAEGGTAGPATGHMIISARSKSLSGPWENSPYNPIIRTTKKSERWWSKGHGTLFEDAKGKWWMVYHAYEKGFYNMGRQTLLQPVEWTKDGWYKVGDGAADDQPIKKPGLAAFKSSYSLTDKFDGTELKPQWKFFGEYDTARFHFDNNGLVIKAKGNSISNSSPLLCVPADHSYTADMELVVEGNATAGLVLFYSERASSGILTNNGNILVNINGWQFPAEKSIVANHAFLRLKNVDSTVDLLYSTDGNKWNKLVNSVDITSFNHNAFGGFMAVRIGLCSIGEGAVTVKNFVYNSIK